MKPQWIAFEGIEGVGKSTQVAFFNQLCQSQGISTLLTREPGGTPIAEAIRQILITHHEETLLPRAEALLMYASRVQHLQHAILPALAAGKWVICDRFHDASFAYQGAGRQLGLERMKQLNTWAIDDYRPDIVFVLDAPVSVAMARILARGKKDRFEEEAQDFFERIRQCYLALAERDPSRYRVIDASGSIEAVQAELKQHWEQLRS